MVAGVRAALGVGVAAHRGASVVSAVLEPPHACGVVVRAPQLAPLAPCKQVRRDRGERFAALHKGATAAPATPGSAGADEQQLQVGGRLRPAGGATGCAHRRSEVLRTSPPRHPGWEVPRLRVSHFPGDIALVPELPRVWDGDRWGSDLLQEGERVGRRSLGRAQAKLLQERLADVCCVSTPTSTLTVCVRACTRSSRSAPELSSAVTAVATVLLARGSHAHRPIPRRPRARLRHCADPAAGRSLCRGPEWLGAAGRAAESYKTRRVTVLLPERKSSSQSGRAVHEGVAVRCYKFCLRVQRDEARLHMAAVDTHSQGGTWCVAGGRCWPPRRAAVHSAQTAAPGRAARRLRRLAGW